ncbi:activator of 90 kDa heat shock protein ATPase homolog 1-like [Saccoglossus kowalevskii]|uniref:Activator of 90 kDa heat shock protein ATPase homolog 1-like n=1 Tax=Saccoglossus kowalevskii TaxID=10224 RepID=A0ABM0GUS8_SACKO|nr:PREDICTED: activator of 90 kDa heat shock protein ATPase homolog 1-like [Saccoglossus kowalevskii]
MAKWGEGDPRWIVEERADATNVNNWHWTEKNASNWSKDKIKDLFLGINVEDDRGFCEITSVVNCEGEASANNRKAKLIFFYEWEVKLEWTGSLTDCEAILRGSIEIPNLSDENEPDEVDIIVTVKNSTEESNILKDIMRKKGMPRIRLAIAKYIQDLKEEFSQGMILPSQKNTSTSSTATKPHNPPINKAANKNGVPKGMSNLQIGSKIQTSKLADKQEFKCAADDLYDALTNKQKVCAYMGSGVEIEAVEGGKFSFLDGNVTGVFTQLVRNEKIVQRWRCKSWPAEHYSTVTIELQQKSDCTLLQLTQTNVPTNELDRTKEGWIRNYWERIKTVFGFGSRLF